jgi:hypothetical protein
MFGPRGGFGPHHFGPHFGGPMFGPHFGGPMFGPRFGPRPYYYGGYGYRRVGPGCCCNTF